MYAFEEYNREGFLKPTPIQWAIWLFLCRGWLIFVMAAASRSQNDDVLPLLLPSMTELYGLMLSSLPIVLLMWLIGLRSSERPRLNRMLTSGHSLTVACIAFQAILTGYEVFLSAGHFSWSHGVTLLVLFWSALYMSTSKRNKASFNNGII